MKDVIIQISNNNANQELELKKQIESIVSQSPDVLAYHVKNTIEEKEYWWNINMVVKNVFPIWTKLKPVLEDDEKNHPKSAEKVVLVLLAGNNGFNDYEMLFCNPQEEMTSKEELERFHGVRRH